MKDSNILIDRYASSIYSIANKDAIAEDVYKNMLKLFESLDDLGDYAKLALSKQVPKKIKSKIWHEILNEFQAPDIVRSFIMLLLENGRISLLPKIISEFRRLLLVDQKVKPVDIYTSFKLSPAQHRDLVKRLEEASGQKIELQSHVDESLLGCMLLRIDSFMLDASIKSKLNNIKQTLLS